MRGVRDNKRARAGRNMVTSRKYPVTTPRDADQPWMDLQTDQLLHHCVKFKVSEILWEFGTNILLWEMSLQHLASCIFLTEIYV
jgi:hypothetical protein